MVETWDAVRADNFLHTVNGALVKARGFDWRILDLEARFEMFDRCGDEGDGDARKDTSETVPNDRKFTFGTLNEVEIPRIEWRRTRWGKEGTVKEIAVHSEGAKHHTVHHHPPREWRSCTFVETSDTFLSNGLHYTIERSTEGCRC